MKTQGNPDKELLNAWHDNPDNWKWGVFYYNKLDKRIFPPKRISWTGWTVNFANPRSYLIFLGFIVALVLAGYFFH
jgi:uncharacterized membrane protein